MNPPATPIVIGIGGVTCGGKSTLCRRLVETLSPSVTVVTMSMDDYYMDDLHVELKETIENWDCVEAIDFDQLTKDLEILIKPANIQNSQDVTGHANSGTINVTSQSVKQNSVENHDADTSNIPNGVFTPSARPVVILLDGIMIYQHPPLRKHFNLRYFITLTEEVARKRRLERRYSYATGEEIIFDRSSYFERYAWPCYLESLRDIESQIKDDETDDIKLLDGSADIDANYDLMLRDITDLVDKSLLHTLQ